MSNSAVWFGLPAYGQVHAGFATSLLELTHLLRDRKIGFNLAWVTSDSHVGRARNTSLSQYLLSGCTGPFQFLDTDLVFCARTLADHLQSVQEGDVPTGLLGGSYPLKRLHPGDIRTALERGATPDEALISGVRSTLRLGGPDAAPGVVEQDRIVDTVYTSQFTWLKCLWLPTGLMTIPHGVAHALAEAYKTRKYETDSGEERWDLFPTLPHNVGNQRILLSEDYAFCQLAREKGIHCWANANLGAAHIGQFTYGAAT